ncbi:MAG: glycoside hydrolase family protein [Phormidesmis sp.]
MTQKTSSKRPSKKPTKKPAKPSGRQSAYDGLGPIVITMVMFLGVAGLLHQWLPFSERALEQLGPTDYVASPLPLEMKGGDPYLRALMRTISAAESNTKDPYRLLYGGDRVKSLKVHPDECIRIVNGPNEDDCTTAAGRYQFLTSTWEHEARLYHPNRPAWYEPWERPSFEPVYQDAVVYGWLDDPTAWGVNLSTLLREGQVTTVLKLLSGTWTSLGYGIEDNSMSALLPQIYEEMLAEELATSASANPIDTMPTTHPN